MSAGYIASLYCLIGVDEYMLSDVNPARWVKDPFGRFDLRYWDGKKWTEHVSTNGSQSKDPIVPGNNDTHVEIIDVSNIDITPIAKSGKNAIEAQVDVDIDSRTQYKKDWFSALPSWCGRGYESCPELKLLIDDLFVELCEAEKTFNKKKNSYDGFQIVVGSGNELSDLYEIAQEEVKSCYLPDDSSNRINNLYSYLEYKYSKKDIQKIKDICNKFQKGMPDISEPIRIYLRMTPSGLPYAWFDPHGSLRDNNVLNKDDMNILQYCHISITKYAEIEQLGNLIVLTYLKVLKTLKEYSDEHLGKKYAKVVKKIDKIFLPSKNQEQYNEASWEDMEICLHLYKICENRFRQHTPYPRLLDVSYREKDLRGQLPQDAYELIEATMQECVEDIVLESETIRKLREFSPGAWKKSIDEFGVLDPERCWQLLEWYEEDPRNEKIFSQAVKGSKDNQISNIYSLYFYFLNNTKKAAPKTIRDILNVSIPDVRQQELFHEIVISKPDLTKDNLEILNNLTKTYVHRITLDQGKIELSQKEYTESVQQVEDYLNEQEPDLMSEGDEANAEKVPEFTLESIFQTSEQDIQIQVKQDDSIGFTREECELFELILEKSNILAIELASEMAAKQGKLLRSWMSEINKKFYEVYDDSLIVISEKTIGIDEEYVEYVKGLLNYD